MRCTPPVVAPSRHSVGLACNLLLFGALFACRGTATITASAKSQSIQATGDLGINSSKPELSPDLPIDLANVPDSETQCTVQRCTCTVDEDCPFPFDLPCLDSPTGGTCAAICDTCSAEEACVTFISKPDVDPLYLCVNPFFSLCAPCDSDIDCGRHFHADSNPIFPDTPWCHRETQSSPGHCVLEWDHCPIGYALASVKHLGKTVEVCEPVDKGCGCSPWAVTYGAHPRCVPASDGCIGEFQCLKSGDLPLCIPIAPTTETCNGLDDNCNGQTDEKLDCGGG